MDTKMNRRGFLKISALAGVAVVVAACTPTATPTAAPTAVPKATEAATAASKATEAATAAPKATAAATAVPEVTGPTGKLIMARGGNLRWPHPFNGGLYEGETSALMYEGLVRNVPGSNRYIGVLAESWSQSADGLTWTFKLKKGIKFANGEEFTAKDIIATYQWLFADATLMQNAYVATKVDLKGLVAVDDYTFAMTTKAAYPSIALLPLMAVVSGKALSESLLGWSEKAGAGTGPWKVVKWTREGIEMTANPLFRDPSVVKIKDYQYRFIGEEATKLAALKTGEVHIIDQVPFEQVDVLKADPKFQVQYSKTTDAMHLNMNCGVAPFNNVLARTAAMYAVDREAIVTNVLGGAAEVLSQIAPESWPEFNPNVKAFPYDPAKSKALLIEAGFTLPVKVKLIQPNAWFPKVLEVPQAIAAQMTEAGFEVDLVVLEGGAFTAARRGSDYNLAFMQAGAGVDLDTSTYTGRIVQDAWGTKFDTTPEYPKCEEMVLAARTEFDPAKRAKIYQDLEAYLHEIGPRVIMYRNWYIWGMSSKVKNFTTWESTYEIQGASLEA